MGASKPRKTKGQGHITGRLRAADPFELIRWLARSQHDPRKALAELVQNSLDAGAVHISVTRQRRRGVASIHVLDDGEGVIPNLERAEALTYIATHIGHSRKRNLTPEQRRELMLQGKYGIGLLGFWCIGRKLEIRTQVGGGPSWVLTMEEDSPTYKISPWRSRLALGGTWTEVVVHPIHRAALASLSGRRVADYLAAELRGQLLERKVSVTVNDRIARGRARKLLRVVPIRFSGRPLPLPQQIEAGNLGQVWIELYLLPKRSQERGRVAVCAAGTIVYDDITDFEIEDFRHPPWSEGRLVGLVDFPALTAAPGTRRGVVPDRAAGVFCDVVKGLEPLISKEIEAEERREAESVGADLLRQLERAFQDLHRHAPQYDLLAVRSHGSRADLEDPKAPPGIEAGSEVVATAEVEYATPAKVERCETTEAPTLLPPGPLSAVRITPARSRLEKGSRRKLRAQVQDQYGQPMPEHRITFTWECTQDTASLEHVEGSCAIVRAGSELGTCTVEVEAADGEKRAKAQVLVEIVEQIPARPGAGSGIPKPSFVTDPLGGWRSRLSDGRWEVNAAHRDYLFAIETLKRKLRYLASLLAKEIVNHAFPNPQAESLLARMVEVLTLTDKELERRRELPSPARALPDCKTADHRLRSHPKGANQRAKPRHALGELYPHAQSTLRRKPWRDLHRHGRKRMREELFAALPHQPKGAGPCGGGDLLRKRGVFRGYEGGESQDQAHVRCSLPKPDLLELPHPCPEYTACI